MTRRNVALSTLLPSENNPRRKIDKEAVKGLAESIKTDGVLQNLVVEELGEGSFRVISGNRRLKALTLLKRQGVIDEEFKVPVEVRKGLKATDSLRIATIENVQRQDLDPIDEAESFATLLQNGGSIDDLSAKTGLSVDTICRRLALANLCPAVKKAVRSGELSLAIAEALTLGTEQQQRAILRDIRNGAELNRDDVREMLLMEKPSAAIAIFQPEKYTGTLTRDLFGEEQSTFFDDADQFMALQKEAVDELAKQFEAKGLWVEVLNTFAVSWWQYRKAKRGEKAGVIINLKPTGRVEIEEGMVHHEVAEEVVEATRETPEAPKERPVVSAGLIRYAAVEKSLAVQAELFENPRKAKEVMVTQLLLGFGSGHPVRIDLHPCMQGDQQETRSKAFMVVEAEMQACLGLIGMKLPDGGSSLPSLVSGCSPVEIYLAVQTLTDSELERLATLLVVTSFGQERMDRPDTETESLFNRVALDLQLSMRRWWVPDAGFLALMRKEQVASVAVESGASARLGKLADHSKKELVAALARHFERTATTAESAELPGSAWLPGIMSFPARPSVMMKESS